ncbi:hypothetical protein [Tatumella saanichensis]|uniref:hypothetical protein n=1 Tax=Tatumella saanichensis TaxID=480813 RepID=UPI0004A387E0|nr:hypothetical protein [Tatumella saanichensis]
MAQPPATQWPMKNIFNPWPVYTDDVSNVIAVKIAGILPHTDGSITIVPEGDYCAVYEPQMFVTIFSPEAGGYLIRDSDSQDLYMPSATFESTDKAVPRGSDGQDGQDGHATQFCSLTTKTMKPLSLAGGDGGTDPNYLLTYWYQKPS